MKVVTHLTFKGKTPSKKDRAHTQKPFTLVLDDLPTREQLRFLQTAMLSDEDDTITFSAGYAVVHKNDQFCRKAGIELATNTEEGKVGWGGFPMPARFRAETVKIYYIASLPKGEIRLGLEVVPGQGFEIRYNAAGRPFMDIDQAQQAVGSFMFKRRAEQK